MLPENGGCPTWSRKLKEFLLTYRQLDAGEVVYPMDNTAEMRLLTVPQFAKRVHASVDEVLALIANRELKALRPDPEGGYRVLETEVDRMLQERTTRIKPVVKSEGAPKSSPLEPPTITKVPFKKDSQVEPTPARTVPMETHLTTVTALETARQDNARLARLSSNLQAELFQYRQFSQEVQDELVETRARLQSVQQELCAYKLEKMELERKAMEAEQRAVVAEEKELEVARELEAAKSKTWWQRLFKR